MTWIPGKGKLIYSTEKIKGKGNEQEAPTARDTDRSKWESRTLIEISGKPGIIIHPCFLDAFGNSMIYREPLIIGKDGKLIIVFARGREDCSFWATSDEGEIAARLIGYGMQV